MIRKKISKILAFVFLLSIVASPAFAADPDKAYLQVAHLAPFADPGTVDIALYGPFAYVITGTEDLRLSNPPDIELNDVDYGDSTAYLELDPGYYYIEVIPSSAAKPAIQAFVEFVDDTRYTAIAIGDGVNQDLDLLLLEDDNSPPAAGNFKLRLGHLAPFADSLTGTTADVRLDDGSVILDDVQFGAVDVYKQLPAGEYDLKITTPDGSTTLINLAPVTFTSGQIVSAFAVGNGSIQALGGFALPADAAGFFLPLEKEEFITYFPLFVKQKPLARLQVVHLAPFADPGTVDIKMNGKTELENVDYGDSTAYIYFPEGSYLVEIFPDGSGTAVISKTLALTGGKDYTAIAVGDIVNQPLDLLAQEDDNSPPAAGNFKLRLGHLAPFASTLAGTTADVRLDDGTVLLNDVQFGAVDIYKEFPAGEYDLKITTPDGVTTLINLAPVTLTSGQILSAFAVGNGTLQPLGGFALPAGAVGGFLPLE